MDAKAFVSFANGERKVLETKLHTLIAAHPLLSVAVALVVGLVLGLVL